MTEWSWVCLKAKRWWHLVGPPAKVVLTLCVVSHWRGAHSFAWRAAWRRRSVVCDVEPGKMYGLSWLRSESKRAPRRRKPPHATACRRKKCNANAKCKGEREWENSCDYVYWCVFVCCVVCNVAMILIRLEAEYKAISIKLTNKNRSDADSI